MSTGRHRYPATKCYGEFPEGVGDHLTRLVAAKEPAFAALRNAKNVQSRDVLAILKDGIEKLGFEGYRLFQLSEDKSYQLDAYNADLAIALEVEKGRVILGNQLYLDLFKFHVITEVQHGAIILPSVSRADTEQPFSMACWVCDVLYSSAENRLNFEGLLLIGY